MNFRDPRKGIIDMAYDMIEKGLLPRKGRFAPSKNSPKKSLYGKKRSDKSKTDKSTK